MNIQTLYNQFIKSTGVSTDSRSITKDNLFIALSGESFNGNLYVQQALDAGASHAVSSDPHFNNNKKVTVVDDTLKTLQSLATHHRKTLNLPIVALTGSNGKTTTKELILAVLSQQFNVKGTKGNLNNHIGVPLTLLSFDKTTKIGVVEMGANHQQEIAALCSIALPNYGLITNYGKAHMEGFGGIEGIKKGKSEMYDFLRATNGTAIILRTDEEQIKRSAGINQILTPSNSNVVENEDTLSFTINDKLVKTQLTGIYNFNNALIAYAAGSIFNVNEDLIIKGIANYTPTNHRSQVVQLGQLTLILDSYNANPSSMQVAIENLASKKHTNKIAVLGDMFELGEYAHEEHSKITILAESLDIQQIHLIGTNFNKVKTNRALKHDTYEAFERQLSLNKDTDALVLIKGSRGMALERILNLL